MGWHLMTVFTQVSSNPPTPAHPNLNLPQPPPFSGVASELPEFKMKLFQLLHGNPNTYCKGAIRQERHCFRASNHIHKVLKGNGK